jgi:tetratricopeptide (TPR) repeat protein
VRESYDHLQTAVRLCEELGTRDGVTRSLCNLGSLLQDCGLYDEARPIQERARVMAAELAAGDLAVSCELNLGLIQEGLGDAAAARDRAERALAESTRLGVKRYIAASLAQRGAARRRLGEIHEAIADLSRAVELAREAGRPADVAEWLGHAALAYLSAGRTDDARGAVEDALGATAAAFVPLPAQLYWVAAQVYHTAGDAAACDRALARAREEFRSRSEALPEERWRAAYAAIPTHREIVAAAERSEWPAL